VGAMIAAKHDELLMLVREQESRVPFDDFENVTALQTLLTDGRECDTAILAEYIWDTKGAAAAVPGRDTQHLRRERRLVGCWATRDLAVRSELLPRQDLGEQHQRDVRGVLAGKSRSLQGQPWLLPSDRPGTGPVGTISASGLTAAEDHGFVVGELATFLIA
jgi:hypothetical protein